MRISPRTRNRLLLVALVALLAIPLVPVLRDFAREVIAVQILRIIWFEQQVVRTIPQPLLWALFLVIAALVGVRSLFRRGRLRRESPPPSSDHPGRVQVLARRIRLAQHGRYFRRRLAKRLAGLSAEAAGYRAGIPSGQSDQALNIESLDAPPEIRNYLLAGLRPAPPRPLDLVSRLTRRWRWTPSSSPLALNPEKVVQFLEDQLEVRHEHRSP